MEVILFPDTEALVITYLKSELPDTPVSTKVPTIRPTRFVKVTRVGGPKIRLNAERALIAVQCWDENTVNASRLARMAHAYLHALAGTTVDDVWIYKVTDVGGVGFNPDSQTDNPRYQFTVAIETRGEIL